MFIKRKTRTGKTYAYLMAVSFKTSLTYKKKQLYEDNCVRCEGDITRSDITHFLYWTLSVVRI